MRTKSQFTLFFLLSLVFTLSLNGCKGKVPKDKPHWNGQYIEVDPTDEAAANAVTVLLFAIRHYDFEPDVMIFSQARWNKTVKKSDKKLETLKINDCRPTAFPNGRRLTDDVANLMCERGDCLLYEVSTAEAHEDNKVHPTTNGTPHLEEFPYLAPPNENPIPPEMPKLRWRTIIILALFALVVAVLFLLPWFLYWRTRKKLRRLETMSAG